MTFIKYMVRSLLLFFTASSFAANEAVIVYTADMANIADDSKGTYAQLFSLLKHHRQQNAPTFFLFGGASLGPSSLSSLDRGSHIIDILNSLEPDVMGVAKREFSYFEDELSLRSYEAAFPLLSSNLYDPLTKASLDGITNLTVLEHDGFRIGVLSVVDPRVVEDYALSRVQVTEPRAAVIAGAQHLRHQGVDLIVLMASEVNEVNDALLNEGIVQLVLHKDQYYVQARDEQSHPNNVLLTKAEEVAVIRLNRVSQNETPFISWQKVSLLSYPDDPDVRQQEIDYSKRLNKLLNEPVGITLSELDISHNRVRTSENEFGNFLADALRIYTGAELALINGGTIGGDSIFPANSVLTRKDIVNMLPYRNSAVMIKASGKQLLQALENGLSLVESIKGRFLQVSGLTLEYDLSRTPGNRVLKVSVGGNRLQLERNYRVATSDFMARGGDGYSMFSTAQRLPYANQMNQLITDIVISQMRARQHIKPRVEGRLRDVTP